MDITFYQTLKEYLRDFPQSVVLDFSSETVPKTAQFDAVLVGCEGGFTQEEKELLRKQKVYRFDTPLVLKSQSAVCAIAAKILL